MKKFILPAAFAFAAFAATSSVALADHIQVANNAPDAWVWVTIINGKNLDAWCVNPNRIGSKDYGPSPKFASK
jgi:hypothetical protein